MCLFSTPWKHRETLQFFLCFQEVEKGCIGNKRVKEKSFCWKTFLRKIFSRLSSKRPDYCGKTFFAVETFYHFYFLSPSSSCAPHAPLPPPRPPFKKNIKSIFILIHLLRLPTCKLSLIFNLPPMLLDPWLLKAFLNVFEGRFAQPYFDRKISEGDWSLALREIPISWACLAGSGLKFIFHLNTHSLIFFKCLFKSVSETSVFLATEKSVISLIIWRHHIYLTRALEIFHLP